MCKACNAWIYSIDALMLAYKHISLPVFSTCSFPFEISFANAYNSKIRILILQITS